MFRKILVIILGLLLLTQIIPKPRVMDTNPFRAENAPMIVAHGGGNQEFPDNTLEAFYNAYSVDPNFMIETDVNLTKDGVVILSHDTTLDRKSNMVDALISEVNYQDIVDQAIDFGYFNTHVAMNGFNETGVFERYTNYNGDFVTPLDVSYPEGVTARDPEKFLVTTLEDLILAFPDNLMSVEIKQSGAQGKRLLDAVIELMDTYKDTHQTFERIVLVSFHEEIVTEFKNLQNETYKDLKYAPAEDGIRLFYVLTRTYMSIFYRDKPALFGIPTSSGGIDLTTRLFINTAQRHNIALHYWTINDPETMARLIELGVDGIMTDRPTLLKQIIENGLD
jgi:glycerophosphoryl diester phosphodiesterase